ncbi:MAG: hypothetical protein UT04_C0044G0020 [Candidatus Daviesbacteria bacterium GW2011_GWF2_38_7]|nr:MAG: hypothetical protein UT04_C0044G0020 [Candidatus Daviesbacteria bacterium GW2011_GWF2_38_7]
MRKAVVYGILAGAGLLVLYLLVMGLASGSWDYTARQLINFKFWIAALVLGFGIQVGLFSYLSNCREETAAGKRTVAAGAGTSTVAMLACCAHHISDVLPFLGLSVLSLTLSKYQAWFLGLGVASNLVGIFLMLQQIRRMKK